MNHWDLIPAYLKALRDNGEGDAADRLIAELTRPELIFSEFDEIDYSPDESEKLK